MMLDARQIERIVTQVLEQLQTPAAPARSMAAAPTPVASVPEAKPAASDAGVLIADQIITQDVLAAVPPGTRRVRIAPRAIITPSARDALRTRNIEFVRDTGSSASSAVVRWQLLQTVAVPQVDKLTAEATSTGTAWDRRLLGLPAEAARQGVSALCRAEAAGVLVLSSEPELVVCLANRNDKVRAAVASGPACVTRIRKSLGANLLAINPAGHSYFELKNLLRAIASGGAPAVPTGWYAGGI